MEVGQLATEFAACDRFGIDPFIQLTRPRDARMALVGYHVGRSTLDNLYSYDTRPKTKPKPGKKPQ